MNENKRKGFGFVSESSRENKKNEKENRKRKKTKKKGNKRRFEHAKDTPKEFWASCMAGEGRNYTVSLALPGSIVDNAQSPILKTYLVGQIARAATIFHIDEVVVFDDGLGKITNKPGGEDRSKESRRHNISDPNLFFARLLQYLETPQYLRKAFFPQHPDLRFAGLLNPLDAPHHVREAEDSPFREGITLDRPVKASGGGSMVNVGLRQEVQIDRELQPGVRVTVKLDKEKRTKKVLFGTAVSPAAPRQEMGFYWGYTTRLAKSLGEVLTGCPFQGSEYDLTIGTSERGKTSVDEDNFSLPNFRHLLIVLGGVNGLEACVEEDEKLPINASETSSLFDMWLNVCPCQGSRTIRTEEAVTITLSRLQNFIRQSGL